MKPAGYAAIIAPNARARATIAAQYIRRGLTHGRAFSNCFEMGDGDEVVEYLKKRGERDPRFAEMVKRVVCV
jgi:hypothetical protein